MKYYKILINTSILLSFLTGLLLFPSCTGRKNPDERNYNILVIHSYRNDSPWRSELVRGGSDGFSKNKLKGDVRELFLDSEYLTTEAQLEIIHDYFDEYARPDLIVLCNDPAIRSYLKSTNRLTYQIPTVFCGANYWDESLLDGRRNVTGFTTEPDYEKAVALMKRFYPKMKGLVLDIDDSGLSQLATETFLRQVEKYNLNRVLDIQINNLDQNMGSSLMWNAFFVNPYPRIMPVWSRFYASRARHTEVPFFSIDSKGLGQGYLGGYIVPAYDQGYQASARGVEILRGKNVEELPVTASDKVFIFDWLQLKKSGISKDKLPPDSVLINQSLFEEYGARYILFVIMGIFAVLLLLVVIFLLYKKAQIAKKRVLEELEEHRRRLKIVMASIREGVVSVDRDMNIFTINPAALYWLQLSGDENRYKGQNILSIMDLSDGTEDNLLRSLIEAVFTTNNTVDFSLFHILSKANNHTSPVVGSISAIYQEKELYGAVIVFHDVTEETVEREFLELTLGSGDVVSWHLDSLNRLITFDPSFFTLNNIKDDGTHSFTLERLAEMIHPDDRPRWEDVNRKFKTGALNTMLLEVRVDADGSGYRWWELRYTSIYVYSEKEMPHIFGLVRNVEHEKQRLQEIEKARDKAQMSDRLKSAFLANMSHEIRTPLNGIVGFSNVLTSDEELGVEERQMFIETIHNNCNLLLGLISDVLDIAQIETGAMSFNEEVCDVNELMNQILVTQRVIIPEHLVLIGDIPEKTYHIITDKLRLNQVITNLINNAVKFTEKGSVTVGYTCEDDKILHFFVEDTGKGIPEADLFNIFERFFKKDDFKQGAGLGLSICKMIIDRFGGDISVTSKLGEGSRFTVTIPLIAVSPSSTDDKDQNTPENSNINKLYNMNTATQDAPTQDNRVTLLIAEDEESNYLLLKTILQKHCNLIRAKTGKEAIEKFNEQGSKVDLILLDIKMPEVTGIEALKEIRMINTDIPVIMQSAYVFDSDMESARQAGASDFITKPINLNILKETLMKYLPALKF
ncbi:MAG: response regulator [Tannerellaceae bacterium]|nr:response regulator [Tannerellaceae bacterium]